MGITRVTDEVGLEAAVDAAREHDPKVVVEAAIEGREIECGVLQGEDDGPAEASLPAEVLTSGEHDFYDFETKYLDGATRMEIPPDLPADAIEEVRRVAVQAFEALDCEASPVSTSSTRPTAAGSSTRSTPCRASPRRRRSRRCGRRPGCPTRRSSTGSSRRP